MVRKVTMYGTPLCPNTVAALKLCEENNIEVNFINITESTSNLSDFILIRDTDPIYADKRGQGGIGIPLLKFEDGTLSRDTEDLLK